MYKTVFITHFVLLKLAKNKEIVFYLWDELEVSNYHTFNRIEKKIEFDNRMLINS